MRTQAVAKGEAILDEERHLAHLFASGHASIESVTRASAHLGELRGTLQAIHLVAHIEATRELSVGRYRDWVHPRLSDHVPLVLEMT